jgi:hypothetical protein
MAEPPALRISDRDREDAVTLLREAAGEGRLTLEELTERVELAYAARTDADLAVLSADLPTGYATRTPAPLPRREVEATGTGSTDWVVAVMGGAERRGRWQLHDRTNVVAVMGGCEIDLREAELSSADVEITAVSVMGGIDILVPDGVFVEVSGLAVMGANENKAGADVPPPGAPVVRVKAYSVMGAVSVKRKRLREALSDKLATRRLS